MRRVFDRRWAVWRLVVALLVVATALPASGATGSIEKKRREAAKISAQIESTGTRIEQLNEDFLTAREQLASLKRRLATSTTKHDAVSAQLTALRAALREQALRELAHPGGNALDALEGSTSLNDVERQVLLAQLQGGRNADLSDALRSTQADLARSRSRLDDARRRMVATTALLARKRKEADALIIKLQALERSTRGELATLVKQDQERRAAEEARQAAAELEKRRKAALAALTKARAEAQRRANRRTGGTASAAVISGGPSTDAKVRALAIEAGLVPDVPTSPGASQAVRTAMNQIGKPYVWAADGPSSFDCSGLMLFAWRAAGRSLPHSSRSQFSATTRVAVSSIRPGDLVFFGRPIHHVGMYIGNGNMVEAPHSGALVRVRSIYRRDLVGVGRVG